MNENSKIYELEQRIANLEQQVGGKRSRIKSVFGRFFKPEELNAPLDNILISTPSTTNLLSSMVEKIKVDLPKLNDIVQLTGIAGFLDKRRIQMPDITELTKTPNVPLSDLQGLKKIEIEYKNPVVFEELGLNNIMQSQSDMLNEMLKKQQPAVKKAAEEMWQNKMKLKNKKR